MTSLSSGVWLHLVCAGAFVIVGATMNALHPVFANRGYQHGRVVLISTHTALVSMASGVFVGIVVLDEAWPARPMMSATRFLAFGCMIYGVITMNWSNIKAVVVRNQEREKAEPADCLRVPHGTGSPTRDVERLSPGAHPPTRRV